MTVAYHTVRDSLKLQLEAGDFLIRYVNRHPASGIEFGVRGVRYPGIIENYRRSLIWAGDECRGLGLVCPTTPFSAYVFDLTECGMRAPFAFWDRDRWGCAIPSRSGRASKSDELRSFRAIAVHEATHCYCFSQPGFFRADANPSRKWLWLAEGTAVWMELRLFERRKKGLRSNDVLEFCREWCDCPYHPMISQEGHYQSGMFVRYLARRFGDSIVGKMWSQGNGNVDPLKLIPSLIECPSLYLDYAVDAYFFADVNSDCYSPAMATRFHSRAASLAVLSPAGTATLTGSLRHTGVDYYTLPVSGYSRMSLKLAQSANSLVGGVSAFINGARIGRTTEVSSSTATVTMPPGAEQVLITITGVPDTWTEFLPLSPYEVMIEAV